MASSCCSSHKETPRQALWREAGLFLLAVFVVFAYGMLAINPDSTPIRTLSLIFASIMLEAMPFMLFGALVGGLIEAFVSRERMTSLLPRRGWVTVLLAAAMGVLFPVCECAVVPVVRRLAKKGFPATAAIAYLLGGPILNPIVAASTALAYKFDWQVVGLRMLLGYGIAVTVALLMGRIFGKQPILAERVQETPHDHSPHDHCHHDHKPEAEAPESQCGCGHHHDHEKAPPSHDHSSHDHCHHDHEPEAEAAESQCGCGHHHDHETESIRARLAAAFRHGADDFVAVGHFLVIGAFIAALAQTFIDRNVFLAVAEKPVLPSMMMILLAVLLNLCSEADAFIAASFRGLMPLPAQIAFMLTGPMLDLKLLLMYQGVFRRRAIVALAGLILLAVSVVAIGLEFLLGGLA